MDCRYTIDDPFDLLSPSLVIFRDVARKNLVEMITMARGPDRLRPHVKTHKMAQVVRMARDLGISKHKCATIAEAEATIVGHSEEHLVVDTPAADRYPVGTCVLAIPTHICPTSALHRRTYVIAGGWLVDEWDVSARDRVIRV